MSGERGRPGERGPVGDHGQAGDKGRTGDTGLTGDIGLTGETGDTGQTGETGRIGKTGLRGHRGPVLAGPLAWVILVVAITTVLVLQGCQIQKNSQTTAALCTFKADLERRVATTDELLSTHTGDMVFGIPRAVIVTSRDNQQRTVEALDDLHCDD